MITFLKNRLGRFPIGIWIAILALVLIFMAWIMQAYSLINWESAVRLGIQNSSFDGSASNIVMANKERGEAIADLIWPLPIWFIAFIGLMRMKFIGFIASMMEFAICIYFPLFYIFQMWETHPDTVLGALFLWGIPSLLGIIGLWANRNNFIPKQV